MTRIVCKVAETGEKIHHEIEGVIAKRKHSHVPAYQRSVDSFLTRDTQENLGKIQPRRPPSLAKLT
jgi:hypothetical protein